MTGKQLLKELQKLSKDELELEIQIVASGTVGRPVYDDISLFVDTNEFQHVWESQLPNVIRIEID